MSLYAVMNGGVMVGRRTITDWANYPAHKKAARDERGDGGPTLRPIVLVGEGPIEQVEVGLERVVITRSTPPPASRPIEAMHLAYIKAALAQIGMLTVVNDIVKDPVLRALWDGATTVRRDDADMVAVAKVLNIDLDDVWARARAIRKTRSPS